MRSLSCPARGCCRYLFCGAIVSVIHVVVLIGMAGQQPVSEFRNLDILASTMTTSSWIYELQYLEICQMMHRRRREVLVSAGATAQLQRQAGTGPTCQWMGGSARPLREFTLTGAECRPQLQVSTLSFQLQMPSLIIVDGWPNHLSIGSSHPFRLPPDCVQSMLRMKTTVIKTKLQPPVLT